MRLLPGYASNVGMVRQTNEDSYLLRRGLYAVCDGMGGARAGEVASEMACRGLLQADPTTADGPALVEIVKEINRAIAQRSGGEASLQGMGTTLTAALAGEDTLTLVHVGDSRAYLLHDGALRQLTDDHSWVAEMMRRGELTAAEAAIHPHRSVITKALGTERELEPDLVEVGVRPGDRLLLCSDGLSGMVSDPDIEEALGWTGEAQEVADLLVAAALAAGGEDNVTVIVVDVLPDEGTAGADDANIDGTEAAAADIAAAETAGAETGEAGPMETQTEPGHGPQTDDDEIILGPVDRAVAGQRSGSVTGSLKGVSAAALGKLGGRLGGRYSSQGDTEAASERSPTTPSGDPQPGVSGELEVSSRKSRRRRWLIITVVLLVLLVVVVGGFAVFNSAVYYVGTNEGFVALYNGLPTSIFGIGLSSVIEQGTVLYDTLPAYVKERIDTHELTSKVEGQNFLRSLNAVQ